MKKRICFLLTVVLFLFSVSSAFAAGYTLPFKMQRQLEVGSGLKGSFVIHSNASAEKQRSLLYLSAWRERRPEKHDGIQYS